VVHGDVEEALDLGGVEVQGEDAIGAAGDDHVRHELGGDGRASLFLSVLAPVAVIRDDRGDARRGGAAETVDEDEQLHQVVVDRVAGREDDEAVAPSDVLLDLDDELGVGEELGAPDAEWEVEASADAFGQLDAVDAGEDLERV